MWLMRVICNMKNILIPTFQRCLESILLEVMKMKMLPIQFVSISHLIQMKFREVSHSSWKKGKCTNICCLLLLQSLRSRVWKCCLRWVHHFYSAFTRTLCSVIPFNDKDNVFELQDEWRPRNFAQSISDHSPKWFGIARSVELELWS
jgi:hypothetical protein